MFFNSRIAAFFLGACISFITTCFLLVTGKSEWIELAVCALVSFSSSFLLIFSTLEFLIFKEINKIYTVIDRIKKKDFKVSLKRLKNTSNPLQKINQEIFTFATKKQQEIDELKKLENYRREFLADISHELKTPIFAAQGFVYTLLDGAVDDKQVRDKFLKKAAKSLDGLHILVQDLLTLSQMETGETKMHFENFDLIKLIEDVIDQLEQKADKRGIKIKLFMDITKPYIVNADKLRISQVLTNLVDNAIKYGFDKGSVEVFVERERDNYMVSIKDNGPGIAPEHLSRIFERFYRIDKSRSKDKGGTGLGLSIVQYIVEAHKSKVSVTSKIGKGTTFSFKLRKGIKYSEQIINDQL